MSRKGEEGSKTKCNGILVQYRYGLRKGGSTTASFCPAAVASAVRAWLVHGVLQQDLWRTARSLRRLALFSQHQRHQPLIRYRPTVCWFRVVGVSESAKSLNKRNVMVEAGKRQLC